MGASSVDFVSTLAYPSQWKLNEVLGIRISEI